MITLFCPTVQSSQQITLKNPELRDSLELDLGLNVQNSMNGSIWSYAQPSDSQKIVYNWIGLNRPQMHALFNFLQNSAGKLLQLTDYDNVLWDVYCISNPFVDIHQSTRNNTITLTFEGKKRG